MFTRFFLGRSAQRSVRRSVAGVLLEVLALAGFVACGRLDEPTMVESSGGQPGNGGSGGAVITGGTSGTGAASGSGGFVLGVGGTLVDPGRPQAGACEDLAVGRIEPPCTDDDIVVPATCWESTLSFRFSLSGIEVPQSDLNLVLLAPRSGSGAQGGQGGDSGDTPGSSSFVLPVAIEPSSAGRTTATGFSVTGANAEVVATMDVEALVIAGYLEPRDSNIPTYPYYVGQVALLRGDAVLDEKRLLVEPSFPCIVK